MVDMHNVFSNYFKDKGIQYSYDDRTGLKVHNGPHPSQKEIEEAIKEYKQNLKNNDYVRLRQQAYPPIDEQLDILYHGGYDKWQSVIRSIKERYPKPK